MSNEHNARLDALDKLAAVAFSDAELYMQRLNLQACKQVYICIEGVTSEALDAAKAGTRAKRTAASDVDDVQLADWMRALIVAKCSQEQQRSIVDKLIKHLARDRLVTIYYSVCFAASLASLLGKGSFEQELSVCFAGSDHLSLLQPATTKASASASDCARRVVDVVADRVASIRPLEVSADVRREAEAHAARVQSKVASVLAKLEVDPPSSSSSASSSAKSLPPSSATSLSSAPLPLSSSSATSLPLPPSSLPPPSSSSSASSSSPSSSLLLSSATSLPPLLPSEQLAARVVVVVECMEADNICARIWHRVDVGLVVSGDLDSLLLLCALPKALRADTCFVRSVDTNGVRFFLADDYQAAISDLFGDLFDALQKLDNRRLDQIHRRLLAACVYALAGTDTAPQLLDKHRVKGLIRRGLSRIKSKKVTADDVKHVLRTLRTSALKKELFNVPFHYRYDVVSEVSRLFADKIEPSVSKALKLHCDSFELAHLHVYPQLDVRAVVRDTLEKQASRLVQRFGRVDVAVVDRLARLAERGASATSIRAAPTPTATSAAPSAAPASGTARGAPTATSAAATSGASATPSATRGPPPRAPSASGASTVPAQTPKTASATTGAVAMSASSTASSATTVAASAPTSAVRTVRVHLGGASGAPVALASAPPASASSASSAGGTSLSPPLLAPPPPSSASLAASSGGAVAAELSAGDASLTSPVALASAPPASASSASSAGGTSLSPPLLAPLPPSSASLAASSGGAVAAELSASAGDASLTSPVALASAPLASASSASSAGVAAEQAGKQTGKRRRQLRSGGVNAAVAPPSPPPPPSEAEMLRSCLQMAVASDLELLGCGGFASVVVTYPRNWPFRPAHGKVRFLFELNTSAGDHDRKSAEIVQSRIVNRNGVDYVEVTLLGRLHAGPWRLLAGISKFDKKRIKPEVRSLTVDLLSFVVPIDLSDVSLHLVGCGVLGPLVSGDALKSSLKDGIKESTRSRATPRSELVLGDVSVGRDADVGNTPSVQLKGLTASDRELVVIKDVTLQLRNGDATVSEVAIEFVAPELTGEATKDEDGRPFLVALKPASLKGGLHRVLHAVADADADAERGAAAADDAPSATDVDADAPAPAEAASASASATTTTRSRSRTCSSVSQSS
jgi:hypothetical protein